MTPFLKQVAQAYYEAERDALPDYCFVFTNKRAATFFEHYLTELTGPRPIILPHATTISDLLRSLSHLTPVSRLDAIFVLYHKYKELLPDRADIDGSTDDNDRLDFDRFLFWGEMLLSDFNDVDRYLVDPERLFVNLKRVREIATDFLTDEQKEVLSRYWGEQYTPTHTPLHFWEHVTPRPDSPDAPANKFVRLWEVLLPLYTSFQDTLRADSLATEGMIIRDVVSRLKKARPDELPFKRFIFVGFNVITVSEFIIMSRLHELGVADFYWDYSSPTFEIAENRAGRFMRRNIKNLPSRYDIEASHPLPDSLHPEISVVSVASGVGQAKIAGATLEKWVTDGSIPRPDNAINTAVVLPDESLFMPMIHAVPEEITALNVTMGFPLRTTPFASFIDSLLHLHAEASVTGGDWQYFYRDVNALLSHPLMTRLAPAECSALLTTIAASRLYMVSATMAESELPTVGFLFKPLDTSGADIARQVYDWLHDILLRLYDLLSASSEGAPEEIPGISDSGDEIIEISDSGRAVARNIDSAYAGAWLAALDELRSAIARRGISMGRDTFFKMLQRAVSSASINFAGMPLSGLQMMGVLETRSLDFDNIIILSMNERVFPQRIFTRSFIPDTLRRAYGMATTDHQESIFAYYFYRLIARARRVTLLYDVRDSGIGSSELSRYVAQLLYFFPSWHIAHTSAVFPSLPDTPVEISVDKHSDPAIMERLRSYCTPGGKTLSVSALKNYLKCPLSFYLSTIAEIKISPDEMDYMDAATFGSVFHEVAQRLYENAVTSGGSPIITASLIDSWIGDKASVSRHIDPLITRAVNRWFLRHDDSLAPLTGEARAMGNVAKEYILQMLEADRQLTPFEFLHAEYPLRGTLTFDNRTINIFQIIDRVDRITTHDGEKVLRFVDYKTGSDATSASEMGKWFTRSNPPSALIQLLFYCCAYAESEGYSDAIMPQIYTVRTMKTGGLTPISIDKKEVFDYRPLKDRFLSALGECLDTLFDENRPFTQTPHIKHCEYCDFKTLCRR